MLSYAKTLGTQLTEALNDTGKLGMIYKGLFKYLTHKLGGPTISHAPVMLILAPNPHPPNSPKYGHSNLFHSHTPIEPDPLYQARFTTHRLSSCKIPDHSNT